MKKAYLYLSSAVVALILFYVFCTALVYQGELAVVMSFGKPLKVITTPGLCLRYPYPFHEVKKFDGRLIMLEPRPSEYLTADKKNLILDGVVFYRIADPVLFMKTVRDQKGLEIRLTDLLSSHTGLLLGVRELSDIVNTDKDKIKFKEMNSELTSLMQQDGEGLGVDIERVFIKRVMLPYDNTLAVYDRMRAERNRIAKKYIAEGEETAIRIRAEADKASRTILAEAQSKATVVMGQADAEAMNIYGGAYRKNLQFYRYIRSLEAYENMFNEKTVIILDEKSPILKTLFSGAE